MLHSSRRRLSLQDRKIKKLREALRLACDELLVSANVVEAARYPGHARHMRDTEEQARKIAKH